jgi:prepilin-type processing-associated H-X9-DG protein
MAIPIAARAAGNRAVGGFNVLPFVEQNNLYQLGYGLPPAQKQAAIAQRVSTPLHLFNCPSRRSCQAWPNFATYYDCGFPPFVGRMDYGTNTGDQPINEFFAGPLTLAAGDDPAYPWPSTAELSGVIFQRSELALTDIPHGTSNTYLIGEKYLDPDHYSNAMDGADNETMYSGFDNDNSRCTFHPPVRDLAGFYNTAAFGSAHPAGLNMAYCDGSVHFIPYSIDLQVYQQAGSRY